MRKRCDSLWYARRNNGSSICHFLTRAPFNFFFMTYVRASRSRRYGIFFFLLSFSQSVATNQGNSISLQKYSIATHVDKFFHYQTFGTAPNQQPLRLISENVKFYAKYLSDTWFPGTKSFTIASDSVHLVFLSKTFNITNALGPNKVVLCSENVTNRKFILRFVHAVQTEIFYELVKNDLKHEIPCSTTGWVPSDLLRNISARSGSTSLTLRSS